MVWIDLPYAVLHYGAPIVFIDFKDGFELGFVEIRELTRTAEKLSKNTPYVVLTDVRVDINVTPIGRKVAADSSECPLQRGTAVLMKSSMLSLAANFFGTISMPKYPFKAFTDRDKAIEWLKGLPLK